MNKYKIKLIRWEDSFGVNSSWVKLKDLKSVEPLINTSIGFEVFRDEKVVVLVPHMTGENSHCRIQGCGDMTIPISAIVSDIELEI